MTTPTILDRYRGCMLGLACGDALGTTLEFTTPNPRTGYVNNPVTDIVGGGPFNLKPGEWTDDTSMALCLAESLVTKQKFDPDDQMRLYCKWRDTGHLSVKGRCFDIGGTVSGALSRWWDYQDDPNANPYCGSTDPHSAANGCLMRLAPAALAYAKEPKEAVAASDLQCRTTHGAKECVDASKWFGALLCAAVSGKDKRDLQRATNLLVPPSTLSEKVRIIAKHSYSGTEAIHVRGSGYVVDTLKAATWAFFTTDNFKDGALQAVNLGRDADTVGAVYGQIAGAWYGYKGIPKQWRDILAMCELIEQRAMELYHMAGWEGK